MKYKLTNKDIRDINNALVFISEKEISGFIPVAMNIVALESKARPITDFVEKVVKKIGTPVADMPGQVSFDLNEFNELTKAFMEKKQDVELEKIKRSDLTGEELKIKPSLITLLIKHGLLD